MNRFLYFAIPFSLLGFAGNNCLAKFAAENSDTDPVTYTLLRLLAGALVLFLARLIFPSQFGRAGERKIDWDLKTGAALAVYAFPFSYAYLSTSGGVGALVLFIVALLTIFLIGWVSSAKDTRPSGQQWIGIGISFSALIWLLIGGISNAGWSELIMVAAGMGWGYYVACGKSKPPAESTLGNFAIASVIGCVVFVIYRAIEPEFLPKPAIGWYGVVAAIFSGSLFSGLAYVIWYGVTRTLKNDFHAGVIQLFAPILVTVICWFLAQVSIEIGESPTLRQLILGCISLLGAAYYFWHTQRRKRQLASTAVGC